MHDLPAFFSDLALILISAGVTTVLFRWLKQPLVLGYMLVGVLIGPSVSQIPVITDMKSVETWSEIGMVFLLFALGLEFKLKKLRKQASSVGFSAITEMVLMGLMGFILGRLIGWSKMDSLFLAAMLCMSSTTIIVKAFEDLKLKKDSDLLNRFNALVIAVERDDFILNPPASIQFQAGDTVWFVATDEKSQELINSSLPSG